MLARSVRPDEPSFEASPRDGPRRGHPHGPPLDRSRAPLDRCRPAERARLRRPGDEARVRRAEALGRGLAHRGGQAQSTRREAAGPRRAQPWTGHEEDPRAGDRGGPREALARARAHPPRDRPPACDDRREGPRLAWRNSRARAGGDRKAWRIGRLTAHTRLVRSNRGPFQTRERATDRAQGIASRGLASFWSCPIPRPSDVDVAPSACLVGDGARRTTAPMTRMAIRTPSTSAASYV